MDAPPTTSTSPVSAWEHWIWIVGLSLCSVLFSPLEHLLDEETYLWIAQQMSWGRPYDWAMPFPPFQGTGFVFAHPPLFLWWVKFFGDSVWTGLPWLILWWWSVQRLFVHTKTPWRSGMLVMVGCTALVLPMTRTVMPDLMMGALGLSGLVLFAQSSSIHMTILSGALIGLAGWTKYPALLLLLAPLMVEPSFRRLGVLWGSAFSILLLGEGWLWSAYDRWHLWEVIQHAQLIGRSPLDSRLLGLPVRLSASLLPFALLVLCRFPRMVLGGGLAFGLLFGSNVGGWLTLGLALLLRLGRMTEQPLWKWSIICLLLGVLVGHNYIAPRYWLLTVPMWWVVLQKDWITLNMSQILTIWGLSWGWSLLVWHIEGSHAHQLARLVRLALEDDTLTTFSGEWGMREIAQNNGLRPYQGEAKRLVVSHNSAGWIPSVEDGWTLEQRWEGASTYCRLVSQSESVGYYADSLGQLPIVCSFEPQPIEVVEIWKKP